MWILSRGKAQKNTRCCIFVKIQHKIYRFFYIFKKLFFCRILSFFNTKKSEKPLLHLLFRAFLLARKSVFQGSWQNAYVSFQRIWINASLSLLPKMCAPCIPPRRNILDSIKSKTQKNTPQYIVVWKILFSFPNTVHKPG